MFYDSSVTTRNARLPFEILLVEDNPGDVRLMTDTVKGSIDNLNLNVVTDGIQAMDYLYKKGHYAKAERPDLILLDLNIPKKNGFKILEEIKSDPQLKCIPILILTISQAEHDILQCYNLHANCYINKPFEIDAFIQLIKSIQHFWFHIAILPPKKKTDET